VTAADVHKTILVEQDVGFLITSVSGSDVTCKSAYSVGMSAGDTITAGSWHLADFSADMNAVSLLFSVILL